MFAGSTQITRSCSTSAHSNTKELVAAAREFGVKRIAVTDPQSVHDPILENLPRDARLYTGARSAVDICLFDDVDEVLVAIVGVAAFRLALQF